MELKAINSSFYSFLQENKSITITAITGTIGTLALTTLATLAGVGVLGSNPIGWAVGAALLATATVIACGGISKYVSPKVAPSLPETFFSRHPWVLPGLKAAALCGLCAGAFYLGHKLLRGKITDLFQQNLTPRGEKIPVIGTMLKAARLAIESRFGVYAPYAQLAASGLLGAVNYGTHEGAHKLKLPCLTTPVALFVLINGAIGFLPRGMNLFNLTMALSSLNIAFLMAKHMAKKKNLKFVWFVLDPISTHILVWSARGCWGMASAILS